MGIIPSERSYDSSVIFVKPMSRINSGASKAVLSVSVCINILSIKAILTKLVQQTKTGTLTAGERFHQPNAGLLHGVARNPKTVLDEFEIVIFHDIDNLENMDKRTHVQ